MVKEMHGVEAMYPCPLAENVVGMGHISNRPLHEREAETQIVDTLKIYRLFKLCKNRMNLKGEKKDGHTVRCYSSPNIL